MAHGFSPWSAGSRAEAARWKELAEESRSRHGGQEAAEGKGQDSGDPPPPGSRRKSVVSSLYASKSAVSEGLRVLGGTFQT